MAHIQTTGGESVSMTAADFNRSVQTALAQPGAMSVYVDHVIVDGVVIRGATISGCGTPFVDMRTRPDTQMLGG